MPFELLKSLRSLKQLDLGGNALQVVKEFWFNKPSYNLSLLYLPQNEIEVIEPFAFADLDGLILLDLSENSIARLQRNMFPKKFSSLRFIYLSYNKITALPSNIFTDMPSLRNIYLDFNHIYTLDADAWSPVWAQIKILDLLGNNVTCNCGIYWMTEVNLPPRFYGECHQPHSLRGHPLNDLWPWHISEAPEMANERCSSIVTSRHSLPN
ncbi:Immunoglobulin superfamily containing leucine-rich repeat protein-like protein [Dinothrombium tinctorium]|uniref:Immunoglobulin superfamily containing leucine-rich repeat protein-like protein n=1 Tax=Dinothrombium tinctorium TaxID=1965070 RepID=A0A3S3Q5N4_9ACAR|nr:Immunoglobulin superfamily containing leucine-rich repeat protein-like protein [Dinothrombium tinctorium]RWS12893.1 Immunoglobulin superfamily containing leucine-rich repeat protein-like protein [Dinothrombium tinctorium]RWS14403.1 Immunoglobulin superfamily containing leucine-rich repeat protein-like protein [Dinothrombium tinctorium]RWS14408.1 Immunoglobulin superfamily containing leucine-rich repeat protein-like protein [Dinothrombium tinctorium]